MLRTRCFFLDSLVTLYIILIYTPTSRWWPTHGDSLSLGLRLLTSTTTTIIRRQGSPAFRRLHKKWSGLCDMCRQSLHHGMLLPLFFFISLNRDDAHHNMILLAGFSCFAARSTTTASVPLQQHCTMQRRLMTALSSLARNGKLLLLLLVWCYLSCYFYHTAFVLILC